MAAFNYYSTVILYIPCVKVPFSQKVLLLALQGRKSRDFPVGDRTPLPRGERYPLEKAPSSICTSHACLLAVIAGPGESSLEEDSVLVVVTGVSTT